MGRIIPYMIWKIKNVWNHQPVIYDSVWQYDVLYLLATKPLATSLASSEERMCTTLEFYGWKPNMVKKCKELYIYIYGKRVSQIDFLGFYISLQRIVRLRTSLSFRNDFHHQPAILPSLSNVSPCPAEGPPPPSSRDCKPLPRRVQPSNCGDDPYNFQHRSEAQSEASHPDQALAPLEACYVPTVHLTAAESSCRSRCDTGPALQKDSTPMKFPCLSSIYYTYMYDTTHYVSSSKIHIKYCIYIIIYIYYHIY